MVKVDVVSVGGIWIESISKVASGYESGKYADFILKEDCAMEGPTYCLVSDTVNDPVELAPRTNAPSLKVQLPIVGDPKN
jgi:hypothetical protein